VTLLLFDFIITAFVLVIGLVQRWLEHNVLNYILSFIRSFEQAFIMITVIAFLLVIVYMTIKHVKRLPKSYVLEVLDVFGHKIIIEGLRINYSTYDAAKSYSQFYANLFGKQYKFLVSGSNRILADRIHRKMSLPANEGAESVDIEGQHRKSES
jgi:hypothetical protein